jgi:hypothetical protein
MATAISGSSCVPLISNILAAQTCGEGVSCMVSVMMYLLNSHSGKSSLKHNKILPAQTAALPWLL